MIVTPFLSQLSSLLASHCADEAWQAQRSRGQCSQTDLAMSDVESKKLARARRKREKARLQREQEWKEMGDEEKVAQFDEQVRTAKTQRREERIEKYYAYMKKLKKDNRRRKLEESQKLKEQQEKAMKFKELMKNPAKDLELHRVGKPSNRYIHELALASHRFETISNEQAPSVPSAVNTYREGNPRSGGQQSLVHPSGSMTDRNDNRSSRRSIPSMIGDPKQVGLHSAAAAPPPASSDSSTKVGSRLRSLREGRHIGGSRRPFPHGASSRKNAAVDSSEKEATLYLPSLHMQIGVESEVHAAHPSKNEYSKMTLPAAPTLPQLVASTDSTSNSNIQRKVVPPPRRNQPGGRSHPEGSSRDGTLQHRQEQVWIMFRTAQQRRKDAAERLLAEPLPDFMTASQAPALKVGKKASKTALKTGKEKRIGREEEEGKGESDGGGGGGGVKKSVGFEASVVTTDGQTARSVETRVRPLKIGGEHLGNSRGPSGSASSSSSSSTSSSSSSSSQSFEADVDVEDRSPASMASVPRFEYGALKELQSVARRPKFKASAVIHEIEVTVKQ